MPVRDNEEAVLPPRNFEFFSGFAANAAGVSAGFEVKPAACMRCSAQHPLYVHTKFLALAMGEFHGSAGGLPALPEALVTVRRGY